jgi:hypothetical protein
MKGGRRGGREEWKKEGGKKEGRNKEGFCLDNKITY